MTGNRAPGRGLDSDVVFVYGALRSGTTLFRLMLEAHGGIANPGEADFLVDHLRPDPDHPTGWRYDRPALEIDRIFLDKGLTLKPGLDGLDLTADLLAQFRAAAPGKVVTLNLHRHAGRLCAILPRVRILHILRDPRDVARSSIGMGWARVPYHGVDHWISTERDWDAIAPRLSPDQVLTLGYEALLGNLDGELRRVCGFLGVAYSPAMLDYHKTSSYGPPDAALTEQWRRHADADEIALVEGKAGTLLAARGYVPTGPGRSPGRVERIWLVAANRLWRWRFNVRRFGLTNVVLEMATRKLGLPGHRRVRMRLNEMSRRHLK